MTRSTGTKPLPTLAAVTLAAVTLAAVTSLSLVAAPAMAEVVLMPNDPLVPEGLGAGDSFQLVFVSSTRVSPDALDGTLDGIDNTTVDDWNSYVNTVASGSTLTGISSLNWSAIVSVDDPTDNVPGVAARDNALVSAPVYRTDGELVATGFDDLWDGMIESPIKWNENGLEQDTAGALGVNRFVWTGSNADGTVSNRPLGNPGSNLNNFSIRNGNAEVGGGVIGPFGGTADWIQNSDAFRRGPEVEARVYGLSEVITVQVIPEPASVALWSLLGLGLAGFGRHRRTN